MIRAPAPSSDAFAIHAGNRRAVAAATTLVEAPDAIASPLLVYGASTASRRELVAALLVHAREHAPALEVVRISAADFAAQLDAVTAAGETDRFAQRFTNAGLIVCDDLHAILEFAAAQALLSRVLEGRRSTAAPVLLATSDRALHAMPDMDPALREVLEQGTSVAIGSDPAGIHVAGGTPTPRLSRGVVAAGATEFDSFLADISQVVQGQLESWRTRLREAIDCWRADGYQTAVLERALTLSSVPDVDGLLATYSAAIEHLRRLETQVRHFGLSPSVAAVFRDPERVPEAERLVRRALEASSLPPGPDPAMSRATFEVGVSNELAVRIADVVSAEPAQRHNPLVLYGPRGVGKTHLANAIGNEWVEGSGGATIVAMLSADVFLSEFNAATREGRLDDWRTRLLAVDAVIVDDLHRLASQDGARAELTAILQRLHQTGRQLVLVSDRPLHEMRSLDFALEFGESSGMSVTLAEPDRTLRERLFARALEDLRVPEEDLEQLAALPAKSATAVLECAGRARAAIAAGKSVLDVARSDAVAGESAAVEDEIADRFFLDAEKVVWDWPDVAQRLIEEPR